jgi:hypothetical protein
MPAGVSAYVALANVTLGSSAASVTFSSITQAYRDLVLVADIGATSSDALLMRVNGDTGSNYGYSWARGNGTTVASNGYNSQAFFTLTEGNGVTNTTRTMLKINFMDYSTTDKQKTMLIRLDNAATSDIGTYMDALRWASNSALTSFVIYPGSGSFTTGTTMALYGIAA